MDADSFAEELFDGGFEGGAAGWQGEVVKGVVGCLEGSCEGGDVVCVWSVDFLGFDLSAPEVVGYHGLVDAVFCQGCVGPCCCAVAVEFGPVALICIYVSLVGLFVGVVCFSYPKHKKYLEDKT